MSNNYQIMTKVALVFRENPKKILFHYISNGLYSSDRLVQLFFIYSSEVSVLILTLANGIFYNAPLRGINCLRNAFRKARK